MKRIFAAVISVVIIISICASSIIVSAGAVSISTSELGYNVSIHTEVQNKYLEGPLHNISEYASGIDELSYPAEIVLSWSMDGAEAEFYTVYFSKDSELADADEYAVYGTSLAVTNLELNTYYYWKVCADVNGETVDSGISSFKTDNVGPRTLYIDGITNVRDLGGYVTLTGDTVKQGRIYRCGRLNENMVKDVNKITDEGIVEMAGKLGVKSEIDLRVQSNGETGYITESPLAKFGDKVNYYPCPMTYGEGIFCNDNLYSLKNVFEILSEEDNYPVIFHCSIGTDRTGMVAYMIEGLLGMSEADMMRDYLYSNFGYIEGPRYVSTIANSYPKAVKEYYGSTLAEKTYNFLNERVGVPKEQLDRIIEMNVQTREGAVVGSPVGSAEEFLNMAPDGAYYLTNNISLDASYDKPFCGTLNGCGYTLTVSQPLFANLGGTISNLNVNGNVSADKDGNAAAVALEGTNFRIEGVTNNANVNASQNAAGFVCKTSGRAAFIGCTNNGSITGSGNLAGFVVLSEGDITFSDCENCGNIIGTAGVAVYAGGFAAKADGAVMVQNCENSGSIESFAQYAGGICGYMSEGYVTKTFITVNNAGKVENKFADNGKTAYAGGIVGYGKGISYCAFSDCKNTGKVTAAANNKIVGDVYGLVAGYNEWVEDAGGWSYYNSEGDKLVSQTVKDNSGLCLLNENGYWVQKEGWSKVDGNWYFVKKDGYLEKGCWKKDSAGWCYLDTDGKMVRGKSVKDKKGYCLVDDSGYWETRAGWHKAGGNWYYVEKSGYLKTNCWMKDSKGWCYLAATGFMYSNRVVKDTKGYCLVDGSGYWVTKAGWHSAGGNWYYVQNGGYLKTSGWMKDSKGWCYLASDGLMMTNSTLKDSKGLCLIDSSGYWVTAKGWHQIGSNWYYVENGGYLKTNGWMQDTIGWCYLNKDGAMLKSIAVKDNKGWVLLDEKGYWVKGPVSEIWVGSIYGSGLQKNAYDIDKNGYIVVSSAYYQ